jgi:hypothetical protein
MVSWWMDREHKANSHFSHFANISNKKNEHGALAKHWHEKTTALKYLSQCHFLHYKSHAGF